MSPTLLLICASGRPEQQTLIAMLPVTFYEHAPSHFLQVCCITNPIWVIKTRLQLQRGPGPAVSPRLRQSVTHLRGNAGPYRGFVHAVKQIAKEEGVQGFYKGLLPSLLLVHPLLLHPCHLRADDILASLSCCSCVQFVCMRAALCHAMPAHKPCLVCYVVSALRCTDVHSLPWMASPSVPSLQ